MADKLLLHLHVLSLFLKDKIVVIWKILHTYRHLIDAPLFQQRVNDRYI